MPKVASARIQYQISEDYTNRVPLAKQGLFQKETPEHARYRHRSSKAALNAAIRAYKANKALVMNTPLNRQPQVVEAADALKKKHGWRLEHYRILRESVTGYIAQKCSGRRNSRPRTIVNGCRTGTSNVELMPTLKKHNSRMYGLVNRSILSAIFMVKMLCFMVG